MRRFNNWLGKTITSGVATMWCAYLFAAIAIYGFPYGDNKPKDIIQWFAQTFLQLVLLSIILVGQKMQSENTKELTSHIKAIHKHFGIKHHYRVEFPVKTKQEKN
jgi:hypothetical protein